MITKTIEFENWDPPSNNEVRRMNSWVYRKMLTNLKMKIMLCIGEGPWPRVSFEKGQYSKAVRDRVTQEVRKLWIARRKVLLDITVRRPRRLDYDNHVGGTKQLRDAFERMGWFVSDHVKWLDCINRPQVIGDPKTIVTLYIPESGADQRSIERMLQNAGSNR